MTDDYARGNAAENKHLKHMAEAEAAEQDQYPEAIGPANDADDIENDRTTTSASTAGSADHAGVTEPDEDISSKPDAGTTKQKSRRPILTKTAAAVIAVTIMASAAVLGWLWKDQHDKDNAERQALGAAVRFVGMLTNVDGAKIDENFDHTIEGSTGEFKDMYVKSSAQLRRALVENKASAHGAVVESAVRSATENTVEVLLFVDQSVSNASAPEPRLDRSRVEITMQKVDGRWLASKVQLP
jgi:Mce-associated membrane protein